MRSKHLSILFFLLNEAVLCFWTDFACFQNSFPLVTTISPARQHSDRQMTSDLHRICTVYGRIAVVSAPNFKLSVKFPSLASSLHPSSFCCLSIQPQHPLTSKITDPQSMTQTACFSAFITKTSKMCRPYPNHPENSQKEPQGLVFL